MVQHQNTSPTFDGQCLKYLAPVISEPRREPPVVYYVNGINTSGKEHMKTALILSLVTEGWVHGIYNRTEGMVRDLAQCAADWLAVARLRLRERIGAVSSSPPGDPVVWNQATLKVYKEITSPQRLRQWKYIVCHSQGNLIVANALLYLSVANRSLAEQVFPTLRVYSLASPSPAWPELLRRTHGGGGRLVYGYSDDIVTWCDPHNWPPLQRTPFRRAEGDWRQAGSPGITQHDVNRWHFLDTNFTRGIRRDLNLSGQISSVVTDSQKLQEMIDLMTK